MRTKMKGSHSCEKIKEIKCTGICVENVLYFRVTSPLLTPNSFLKTNFPNAHTV